VGHPEDDEHPEGWNPEDENLEKKLLKKYGKLVDKSIEQIERAQKEEDERRKQPIIGGVPSGPHLESMPAHAMGIGTALQIRIVKIDNGYLLVFPQFQQSALDELQKVKAKMPSALQPVFLPSRQAEYFVSNAEEALPYIRRAMEQFETIIPRRGAL